MTKINMLRIRGKRGDEGGPLPFTTSIIILGVFLVLVVLGIIYVTKAGKGGADVFYKGINVDLVKQACQNAKDTNSKYDYCYVLREVKYKDVKEKEFDFKATCFDLAKRETGDAKKIPANVGFPGWDEAGCVIEKEGDCVATGACKGKGSSAPVGCKQGVGSDDSWVVDEKSCEVLESKETCEASGNACKWEAT